jgi:hypothetical protein
LVAVISKLDRVATIGKARLTERGKPKRGRPLSFSQRTLNAVRKFIYWRHDGPCHTDDWVWHLDGVLPLLVQISKEKGHPAEWVRRMADEMFPRMDCCREWWDEQIDEASLPVGIKVDTIAKRLGIKETELDRCFGTDRRKRCGLVSVDRPKKIRANERAEEKATQKAFKRSPHRFSHSGDIRSIEKAEPWEREGISRRMWYYRRAKMRKISTDCTEMTPNTLTISVCPQNQCNAAGISKDRFQEEKLR